MERKHLITGAVCAVAILLPVGRWLITSRQDAAAAAVERAAERAQHPSSLRPQGGAPGQTPGRLTVANAGAPGGPNSWRSGPDGAAPGPDGWRSRGGDRPTNRGGWGNWGGTGSQQQREQMRARRTEALVKAVGLNPTQLSQLQAIQRSARPLMADIFRNPNLSQEQKRASVQQIQAAQQAQLSKFLSPDQTARYVAFQQQMRSQWQSRRGNGGQGIGG